MGFADDLIIGLRSNEKSSIYPLTVTVSTRDRWRCFTSSLGPRRTLTARCSEFSVCACRNQLILSRSHFFLKGTVISTGALMGCLQNVSVQMRVPDQATFEEF